MERESNVCSVMSFDGYMDEMETDSVRKTDAQLDYLKAKSPPNKPSVRLSDAEEAQAKKKRKIYGGVSFTSRHSQQCVFCLDIDTLSHICFLPSPLSPLL